MQLIDNLSAIAQFILRQIWQRLNLFMYMNTQLSEILQLSVAERIQLVEDIWDSIAVTPEAVPLTEEQKAELDRRVESYRANPKDGVMWQDLKNKLSEKR